MIPGYFEFETIPTPPKLIEDEDGFVDLSIDDDKTTEVYQQNVQKGYIQTAYYTGWSVLTTAATRAYSLYNGDATAKGMQLTSSQLQKMLHSIIGGRNLTLVESSFFTGSVDIDRLDFSKPVVIPMLVHGMIGYHMTLLYIYPDTTGLHIEFYDGKALHIDDPLNKNAKAVYDALLIRFNNLTFEQLKNPKQYDVHNCGPLAAWFLERRLEGFTLKEIEALEAPDIESYRAERGL